MTDRYSGGRDFSKVSLESLDFPVIDPRRLNKAIRYLEQREAPKVKDAPPEASILHILSKESQGQAEEYMERGNQITVALLRTLAAEYQVEGKIHAIAIATAIERFNTYLSYVCKDARGAGYLSMAVADTQIPFKMAQLQWMMGRPPKLPNED